MEFSIKEWRRMYYKIKELGHMLQQSRVDADGNPAPYPLPREERLDLESQIDNLMKKNDRYLDACGKKCPPPLWIYNAQDKRTWVSHESFKYTHFMEF